MIYFLQSPEGGTIKIGHSINVPGRIKQLEAHYGQPLALLATMPGGRDEEQELHARFATARIGRTEQFRPVAEIMAFIGRPLLVSPDPDAVEAMPATTPPGTLRTIGVRGTAEWADWLERLARHNRTDVAKVLDAAAKQYAVSTGFDEPPPERVL